MPLVRDDKEKDDGDTVPPPAAAASGSSSQDSEIVSEDEHIHHLERSGALNQVAGSQSILSQELYSLGETKAVGGLSQLSEMGGFSQASEASAESDFDSQRVARKYGLLSQDPFALPARSLQEPPLSQRSTSRLLLPPSDSQGSSNSESNFGTLLEAVQLFQSQEVEEEKLQLSQDSHDHHDDDDDNDDDEEDDPAEEVPFQEDSPRRSSTSSGVENIYERKHANTKKRSSPAARSRRKTLTESPSKRAKKASLPLAKSKKSGNSQVAKKPKSASSSKSSSSSPKKKAATPAITPKPAAAAAAKPTSDGSKKRKRKNDSEAVKQQQLAQRAAALAQRTINDADLAKRLLLSMALTRENPRSAPETLPGPGFSLPEGFFWAHYPPLEKGTNFLFMNWYFGIDAACCSLFFFHTLCCVSMVL